MDNRGVYWKEVREIMEMRNFITISAKRKVLYISKYFREQLNGEVNICVNPHCPGELLLTVDPQKSCRSRYGCTRLWKQLEDLMRVERDVRFIFFRRTNEAVWVGYLLPTWSGSYLWETMTDKEISEGPSIPQDNLLKNIYMYYIKRRYWKLIEAEEVEFCFRLGRMMAERAGQGCRQRFLLHVLYANELVRDIAKTARRCAGCESSLSLDAKIFPGTENSYDIFFGTIEGSFDNMIVEEFRKWLTGTEQWVLDLVMYGDALGKINNIGERTKVRFHAVVESIQNRAVDYFGQDYIKSMLAGGKS